MTEAFEKWVDEVNRRRRPGGEIGIIHKVEALNLLRAFVGEVDRKTSEPIYKSVGDAFVELVREFGLDDGEK